MGRLSTDPRFTLEVDYNGPLIPNPARLRITDPDLAVAEVAAMIYTVAEHAVLLDGRYIAGSAADRDKHAHRVKPQ